jgi:hypothetical protein
MQKRYGNTRRRVLRGWWMSQRVKHGHEYVRDCEWCQTDGAMVWYPYSKVLRFANGRSYGRWYCRMYGQCEAAPG